MLQQRLSRERGHHLPWVALGWILLMLYLMGFWGAAIRVLVRLFA